MIEAAYALLRVERNASPEDVRKAYVRLVRRYPPEHFPEKFAELRKAYQQLTLSDDFITEIFRRVTSGNSALGLAACLWGDRKELTHDRQCAPEELSALLEGDRARRSLDDLLAATEEIEWRIGGAS